MRKTNRSVNFRLMLTWTTDDSSIIPFATAPHHYTSILFILVVTTILAFCTTALYIPVQRGKEHQTTHAYGDVVTESVYYMSYEARRTAEAWHGEGSFGMEMMRKKKSIVRCVVKWLLLCLRKRKNWSKIIKNDLRRPLPCPPKRVYTLLSFCPPTYHQLPQLFRRRVMRCLPLHLQGFGQR